MKLSGLHSDLVLFGKEEAMRVFLTRDHECQLAIFYLIGMERINLEHLLESDSNWSCGARKVVRSSVYRGVRQKEG